VVPEVILCLLCKWRNENLNALIWYFTKFNINSLLYAREIHTFDNEIQTYKRRSFPKCVHAHISQIKFIFKFLNRRLVQFELYPLYARFADFLLSNHYCERSFKRIQQVLFEHCEFQSTWTSFLKILEAMRLKARLTRWQRSLKRFDSSIAGLLSGSHKLGHFRTALSVLIFSSNQHIS